MLLPYLNIKELGGVKLAKSYTWIMFFILSNENTGWPSKQSSTSDIED